MSHFILLLTRVDKKQFLKCEKIRSIRETEVLEEHRLSFTHYQKLKYIV